MRCATILLAIGMAVSSTWAQTTFFVDGALATGAATGASWADAFRGGAALQDALGAAQPIIGGGGSVRILVAKGVYAPTAQTIAGEPRSATFSLLPRTELQGGFVNGGSLPDPAANPTVLSGNFTGGRVWHVVTGTGLGAATILDGVTVSNGFIVINDGAPQPRGAGMLLTDSSPLIRRCTFTGNRTDYTNSSEGGAIFTAGGRPTLTDCTFTSNYAYAGGGALCGPADVIRCTFTSNGSSVLYSGGGAIKGNCSLESCVFTSNTSGEGGAVLGSFQARACTFTNNSADAAGAGTVSGTFEDCTFTGNSAHNSYGVISGSSLTLRACRFTDNGGPFEVVRINSGSVVNCLFRNNSSVTLVANGAVSIVNCTFLANQSPALRSYGDVVVSNSVFWQNGGVSGPESSQIQKPTGTLTISRTCVQGLTGSLGGPDNFSVNPALDAEGRPKANSPCIDYGDAALVPPGGLDHDAFGERRLLNDAGMPDNGTGAAPIDIGAAEFQGTSCYANCDLSATAPALNIADFACFLRAFAAASPYANCDASGPLSVADFSCFLTRFAAGCP